MRKRNFFVLLIPLYLFFNCQDAYLSLTVPCESGDLGVTQEHHIVDPSRPSQVWRGEFSEDFVIIKYFRIAGLHGESSEFNFRFKKSGYCLEPDYAYWTYRTFHSSGSNRVGLLEIISFEIQDWEEDVLLSGELTFRYIDDPDIAPKTHKFWVEFEPEDEYVPPTPPPTFEESVGAQLPIKIDLDNDSIDDFVFDYSLEEFGLSVLRQHYSVRFDPLHTNNDVLLREEWYGDTILFGTSQSSSDAIISEESDRDFSYRLEFEEPYREYNQWLLVYRNYPVNWLESYEAYVVVRMKVNGQNHYGWVKFRMKFVDHSFEVLETYFHPVPNEHITPF